MRQAPADAAGTAAASAASACASSSTFTCAATPSLISCILLRQSLDSGSESISSVLLRFFSKDLTSLRSAASEDSLCQPCNVESEIPSEKNLQPSGFRRYKTSRSEIKEWMSDSRLEIMLEDELSYMSEKKAHMSGNDARKEGHKQGPPCDRIQRNVCAAH